MIGLLLQGVGAASAGAHDAAASPQSRPPASDAAPSPPRLAASSAPPPSLTAAAAAQGGLAPLLADIEAALSAPDLPAAVRTAAEQVLQFGLQADEDLTAAGLQSAVASSGLFLEAQLVTGAVAVGDFKSALLGLARALGDWSGTGSPAAASSRPAPPPPFPGGPVRGQGAAVARVDADTPPAVLATRLLGETRAALSRQTLMQSASAQPSDPTDGPSRAAARWLFELPLAQPQGRSVAQFEIARDGRRGAEAPNDQTWRTRFSLDVEGLGPVHAALSLTSGRLHVSLWAERQQTEGALAEGQAQLRDELQDAGLSAEVSVRAGAPPTPTGPAGRFMDTAA